jgi:hypothetical protein
LARIKSLMVLTRLTRNVIENVLKFDGANSKLLQTHDSKRLSEELR